MYCLAVLDEYLLAAYRRTTYRVFAPPLALRVNQHHPALDDFLRKHAARQWSFITAYHPGSVQASAQENDEAQQRLEHHLRVQGYAYYPGAGIGDTGDWPPEPSFLVVGMDPQAGLKLANTFGQLGILWGQRGSVAQLLFT